MAHSVRDVGAASLAAWRRLLVHEGEALASFGRELRGWAAGPLPVEIAVRDVLGAVERGALGAAPLWAQIGAEAVSAGLAAWGVRVLAPPAAIDRDAA